MDNYLGYNFIPFSAWYNTVPQNSGTKTEKTAKKEESDLKKYLAFKETKQKALEQFQLDDKRKEIEEKVKVLNNQKKEANSKTSFSRWLSNAGASLKNMAKGILGYDEKGFNSKKLIKNVAITSAAIGACFIPYVGPFIGYGLLTAGVVGGGIGVAKGLSDLDKAKTSNDIDKAQQNVCSNALMTALSLIGLKGMGSSFRTAAATSSQASSATVRSGVVGKTVEGISNFGRDITVNAFRSAKYASKMSAVSHLSLRSLKNNDAKTLNSLKTSIEKQIADVDTKLALETDLAKKALLQEQRMYLESNLAECNGIGTTIKTQSDFKNLLTDNSVVSNKDLIATGYVKNAAGKYEINGQAISQRTFNAFKKNMLAEQTKLQDKISRLVEAREMLMKKMASKPKKYALKLDEYVDITNIEKSSLKPSHWFKNEYQIALKNQNANKFSLLKAPTRPYAMPLYASSAWFDPMYSQSDIKDSIKNIEEEISYYEKYIKAYNNLNNASNKEDFEKAIKEISALESKQASNQVSE